MKKLVTLLAAAGMVVAASAPANAVDVKVSGFHAFTFETQQQGFEGQNLENAWQRTRLGLNFVASENLSGFLQFQMGSNQWGDYAGADKHGRNNVQTRQAYVDWIVPGTSVKVRMGRQQVGLPGEAFGDSSVMSAGWGGRDGIAVSAPVTDWLALNALWVRAGFAPEVDGDDKYADVDKNHNSDVFGLAAPMKFNGFAVTPWVAYAALDAALEGSVGQGASGIHKIYKDEDGNEIGRFGGDADAYWAGVTATFSYFDPFTLKASFTYGSADIEDGYADKEGWNAQVKATYKTAFGTPALGFWYASGDDKNAEYEGEGTMAHIKGRFMPTTTYHNGAWGLGGSEAFGREAMGGTWGVFAGIEGVSFIADLEHYAGVTYLEGTNHKDNEAYFDAGSYLTEEDSIVEFDFGTTYNIYKNFVANLELSYLINDFGSEAGKDLDEDDWRIGLTFQYNF